VVTQVSNRTHAAAIAIGVPHMFLTTLLTAATVFNTQGLNATESRVTGRELSVRNSAELLRAARAARPGTTILLAPGTYRGGLTISSLQGTADQPIVVTAADPNNRPVIEGGTSCLHLTDPAHVELRDLVLTGARVNGLNIDDGGSYDTPAHHVVIHGLTVRDVGSDSNHDGIKLSGLNDFRIENCTVQRWGKKGSGIDMVGCHAGVVTDCTFREGDKVFGNAVQMKGGSRDITVSYCQFHDAGGRAINIGGSTGLPYFRPPSERHEAKNITVADCTFVGSMAPIAFVGVDGAHVHHNTIYRPARWIIRILQENQNPAFVACRNGRFTNNIVAFRSDELASTVNIGPGTMPKSFEFSKNFWYCIDRPDRSLRSVQLPSAEQDGTYGTSPEFIDADKGDLSLSSDSPAKSFGPRAKR
jgi:pectate lyase